MIQENGDRSDATPVPDPPVDRAHERLERRLSEAWADLWDNFVDPREAFWDDDGGWLPLAAAGGGGGLQALIHESERSCARSASNAGCWP